MKLREDQQRLKDLLKDTITLLCKNGLQYKDEFCVEALIGITLDQENVFLVNIKETIQLPSAKNGDDEISDTNESIDQVSSPKSSRKRTHGGNVQSSHVTPSKQQRLNPSAANPSSSTSSPQPVFNIKTEANTDGDDAELVFVKEEQNAFNSGQMGSSGTNVPYPVNFGSSVISMPGSQGPGDPIAGGGFQMSQNLVNTSLDSSSFMQGSGVWPSSGQKSTGNQQEVKPFKCTLCSEGFSSSKTLDYHMRGKHDIGEPIMCSCGTKFATMYGLYTHRKKLSHPAVAHRADAKVTTSSSKTITNETDTYSERELIEIEMNEDITSESVIIEITDDIKPCFEDTRVPDFIDSPVESVPTDAIYEAGSFQQYSFEESNQDFSQSDEQTLELKCNEEPNSEITELHEQSISVSPKSRSSRRKSKKNLTKISY